MRQLEKMPRPFVDTAVKKAKRSGIARIHVLLAILVFCCSEKGAALDPTSRISQYGHTVWRVQDGYFGGAAPVSITQTTDGYIWVGTLAGIYRFDGVRFVRWNSPSGEELPSSSVLDLVGGRDGSLWIGTMGGLAHLVKDRLTVYQKNEGRRAWNVIEDREGKIWFVEMRSEDRAYFLCQVLEPGVRCYGTKEGLGFVRGFAQDPSGDFWVRGPKTIVKWRPGARYESLLRVGGSGQVGQVLPESDGSAWVGIDPAGRGGGLQRLVDGTLRPFLAPKLNGEIIEVLALRNDRQKNLWVGTANQGLYRIRGTDVDHYGAAEGLSSDVVMAGTRGILEDREGNIWVVTARGLDMFRDLRVRSISKLEGLEADGVDSVAAARDGSVWIGTVLPLVTFDEARKYAVRSLQLLSPRGSFGQGKELPRDTVATTFIDHAGRLWAGMNHKLFVYEQGRFREITKENGSDPGFAVGITEDSEHNIWVEASGQPGALLLIKDLKVRKEFPPPAVPLARKIVADPRDGIWLGLMTGDLAHYRDGQIDTFSFGDHPKSPVTAIMVASDGSVLGGTGFGVVGWKDEKKQVLNVRNGLPCNEVNALISDDAGNLWLYAQCGLIKVGKDQMQLWWEDPDRKLKLRVFDTFDGVQPGLGWFNNSTKTPDGRLWFANSIGVQVIDPAHMPENAVPPPVDVSGLVADHKAYAVGSAIRLPPLTRDLEIDYTALSYVVPQKVLFRYILEGHDAGWQEPGTRRQAFYNDLGPGRYSFRVIACNNDGVWNEAGASLDFYILPAYYQTTWFRIACAAVVLLLLWAAYRFRVQQLGRRFAVGLEARVKERTRIARDLHDTLLQSFQGLMLRLQLVEDLLPEGKAKDHLEQTLQRADQAIAEGRRAVYELRSSTAAPADLVQAVRSLGDEFATENSAAFNLVVEGAARDLNPIIRDEVYLITREALRNAFSHARAHHIEAEITHGERAFRLRIRDDGDGIPTQILEEGRPGHYGLSGMRERAKQVGGKLELWSRAGAGTEIDLSIPNLVAYRMSVARPLFSLFGRKASSFR
jgi:signal transduction histidine kinase/ligand-binding sensor domain-containing protein